eukprot:5983445-Amphidinium_carterae.1
MQHVDDVGCRGCLGVPDRDLPAPRELSTEEICPEPQRLGRHEELGTPGEEPWEGPKPLPAALRPGPRLRIPSRSSGIGAT